MCDMCCENPDFLVPGQRSNCWENRATGFGSLLLAGLLAAEARHVDEECTTLPDGTFDPDTAVVQFDDLAANE